LGQGRARLKGKEGLAGSPEVFFHVLPWGKTALTPDPFNLVCYFIEQKEPVVGHPDIIEVGVAEGESHIGLLSSIAYGVGFVPGIAGRF
jgi:hypothetical protein